MESSRRNRRFAHLHVHSHYSLLEGTASIDGLVARASAEGMTHLALTDSNALYGAVAFDRACRDAGIQPILGMTVKIAPPGQRIARESSIGRLVLLAKDRDGYRSLCALSSSLQACPKRETRIAQGISWEELEAHSRGLLCLSGGRRGWIEHLLRVGDRAGAAWCARKLKSIYAESAYLSMELHQPEDRGFADGLVGLGQQFGLRTVAVQPVYCLSPEEQDRFRLLAAIEHNIPLESVDPASLPTSGSPDVTAHWLGREAVETRFAAQSQALDAIEEVIAQCGSALPSGAPIWPDLDLPDGLHPNMALSELASEGLEARYGASPPAAVRERLQTELGAIAHHGYAPLFLVVSDIARFARARGVPVNTRGSVANSLVAYCSGITNVDPIEHDLLFERFLNPARADLPDIDMDFCSRRRGEVLEYVRQTHGPDRVALVATVSTLQPRGGVRETGKAYGLGAKQIAKLVSMLPRRWHPDPRRRDKRTVSDVLAELEDPLQQQVVREAYHLVDQPHHLSVHPGGVVITPGPLTEFLPVQWAPKGFLITQFSHGDVEAIGLPKLDLLGIRALTVLAEAEKLVQERRPGFALDEVPGNDVKTAQALSEGETIGVFQCESQGARRTLRQLKATSVRDLAVANAFFKPGPATGGMARTFIRRYRDEEPVAYLHPSLAPILEHTKGVLIFQEQILRVAREIAGLSWEQADQLRRGMSHFGHREMADMQKQFIQGCLRQEPEGPGFQQRQAEILWDQVHAFAGYGFNQGHATSYAVVSYRSAYLKTQWPAEFLCARLANWGGFHHPAIYMAEAVRLGLAVRPPHVNESRRRFTLSREEEPATLWMGLGQVRDLRQAAIRDILVQQRRQRFTGLRDFISRVQLQRKEITHLIQCGALDGLGESRAALLAEAEEVQRAGSARQMMFSFALPPVKPETMQQRITWEHHILGQPVSNHPLEIVADRLPEHCALQQLSEMPGRRVVVAGIRLPGWTGGHGFYLGDGTTFIIATTDPSQRSPAPWRPVLLRGWWRADEWGFFRLHVSDIWDIPSDSVN